MHGLFLAVFALVFLSGCPEADPGPPPASTEPINIPTGPLYPQCSILPPGPDVSPPLLVSPGLSSVTGSGLTGALLPWYLQDPLGINIEPAWAITEGSNDVTIAVMDSGFLPNNAAFATGQCGARTELIDLLKGLHRAKETNHGAAVASVISDCSNNSLGLEPINRYSPVQWINDGDGTLGIFVQLLAWVVGQNSCTGSKEINCNRCNPTPADIINASSGLNANEKEATIERRIYLPTIELVNAHGSIFVASAGNDHQSSDLHFPSNLPGVISAGASGMDGTSAGFSDWGETVETIAPGSDIKVAQAALPFHGLVDGTSFSAPIVSAVISLMRSVYPALNWKTAIYFLQITAKPMNCDEYCSPDYDNYKNKKPSFSKDPRGDCKKDCCNASGSIQFCTPGRVDAGRAVAAAQFTQNNGLKLGVPVSLVDSDKYLVRLGIALAPDYRYQQGTFTLKNVGGVEGHYELSSKDNKLRFDMSSVVLPSGGSQTITVTTTSAFTKYEDEAEIRIATKDSGKVAGFSDELVIYAQ